MRFMKKPWVIVLILLAVISLVIAIIYLMNNAGNIPSFFPGYLKNSPHKHIKHALAFISLAVVFAIGAWMISGNKGKGTK
jgi:hypothetical protein